MNENKNEQRIAIKFRLKIPRFSELIILFKQKIETAPSVGIDNKKDIIPASYLLNLSIRAAEIVIPDRLTPGIKDKI